MVKTNKCFKPPDFGSMEDCCLHHLSGAYTNGYGQVSYLYLVGKNSKVH